MSRYNQHSGSGTGGGNQDYDDTTLKLQKYAALNVTGDRVKIIDTEWGDRLIAGFDDVAAIDGVLMQRDDKPGTWKLFGFGDLGFEVGEDGRVYESYDAEAEEYQNELSAADILDHPRTQGFSEGPFGNTGTLWYTPVGVIIEAAQDIALNEPGDGLTTEPESVTVGSTDDERSESVGIEIGEVSMLLGNKSWVRTLAKLITETGGDIIATEENDDGDTVPVSDDHGWLTVDEADVREDLEGREMELFVIEESGTFGGEEVNYSTPILLDVKTGERITIDNDANELEASDGDDSEQEAEEAAEPEAVAADGGTAAASQTDGDTESPEEPDASGESDGEVPEVLDDLIDYFARTQGEVEPDDLREFAEDEVDDPSEVDWEAAAQEVEARAEDQ